MQFPLKSLVLAGLIVIAYAASSHAMSLDQSAEFLTRMVCDIGWM